jgi:hypothetical protein
MEKFGVKLAITSDLHADFGGSNIMQWTKEPFDVLMVAGDTANSPGDAAKVLLALNRYSPLTLAVDGNHESYNNNSTRRTPGEIPKVMQSAMEHAIGKDHVLNVKMLPLHELGYSHEGRRFIGFNGWYTMDAVGTIETNLAHWQSWMNDSRYCNFVKDGHPVGIATEHAFRVSESLREARKLGERAVVMTHTAPARECLVWRPESPEWDRSNGYYMNSHMTPILEEYADIIDLWVHGHTHYRGEVEIAGVRVIRNPRGYPGENRNWEPVIVEV